MRSNEIVSRCLDYFHGFQDVKSPNKKDVINGLLKIFSYILLIPPLIFGAIYLHNRKLAILETKLDKDLDNIDITRITSLYHQSMGQNPCPVTQEQFREYLSDLAENISTHDYVMKERFQKAFKLLQPATQITFFENISSPAKLEHVIDMLPRDLEELHFSSGTPWAILYYSENGEHARVLLKKFNEFTQLKTLTLDFRGIGFFSPRINSSLKAMTGHKWSMSSGEPQKTVRWDGTLYSYPSGQDNNLIVRWFQTLRDKTTQGLKYEIRLMNLTAYNHPFTGSNQRAIYETIDETEFPTTVSKYLSTPP